MIIWSSWSLLFSQCPMMEQITDPFLIKIYYLAWSSFVIKPSSQWHLNDFKNLIHPVPYKFNNHIQLILHRFLNAQKNNWFEQRQHDQNKNITFQVHCFKGMYTSFFFFSFSFQKAYYFIGTFHVLAQ